MKQKLLKTLRLLLVAVGLGVGANDAWAQGLWDFTDTSKWSDSKFSSEATYGPDGSNATLGGSGITFNLDGKVTISQDAGMSFKSDAFTTLDENNIPTNKYIKVSVPAGYKVAVEYYGYNTSRYLGFTFNGERTTGPAVVYTKKEFDNSEGVATVDLYIYKVDNDDGKNRDGHARLLSINLVDMTTPPHKWTVSAKASINGVLTEIDTWSSASGNYTTAIHEGECYYVPAKRFITYNDKKYELNDANYSGKYIYKRYVMGTSDANHDITYTEASEIVYYSEIEDATNKQHVTSNKASGGKYVNYMTTNTINEDFPAGKYIAEANTFCRKYGNETYFYLYPSDNADDKLATFTAEHNEGIKTAEFELTSSKTLVYGNSSNSAACDYILIRTAPVAYTVQYKCGETVLKAEDASRTAVWGTTVAITDADKGNILYNHATYEYSSDNASSTTIAADGSSVITVEFTQVPFYTLADVTEATTWDWSVVTSSNAYNELTDATTPTKTEAFVLKNVELYGKQDGSAYIIPDGFGNAQQLEVITQYPFRRNNDTSMFQGSSIKFHTTIPGTIEVQFSNTGNNDERHLTVNGIEKGDGTSSTDKVTASDIPVAAGEVVLGASTNYLRFYKIIFTPNLEVANAIADCKTYETSAEFATYIDGNAYATAAEVYAAHTAWQIAHATVTDGKLDVTKSILDAAVSELGGAKWNNANVWNGSSWNEKYTEEGGAPDNNYFDVYENTITAKQTIYGVPAGVYVIKAATRSAKDKGVTGNLWAFDGTSNIGSIDINSDGNTGGTLGNGWSWSEMTVTLTETKNLEIGFYANASSEIAAWAGCDDWHMYKIESDKSLNASGYSTFSSSLNLQLTGADAYTATLDLEKEKITCTKIDDGKIPAGTGVLLYGENNAEVTFTVIESAPALSNNDLKATTLANGSLAAKGENTYYVLSGNTFMQYTGAAFAAGKAYFEVNGDAVQARKFTIVFDNESTGIQTIDNSQFTTDNYYNLKGQRVTQPTKGLYIVNGKKVLVNDKR